MAPSAAARRPSLVGGDLHAQSRFGLLDMSNATVIARKWSRSRKVTIRTWWRASALIVHGYLDGYSIRVFRKDKITEVFKVYHAPAERLANSRS